MHTRNAPVQDPARLMDSALGGVPQAWRQAIWLERPNEGINLCGMNGRPGEDWAFESASAPALALSILLEGRMEAAFEDGAAFGLGAGQALLMAAGQHTRGWNVLSGAGPFRLLNLHLSPQALRGLTGMDMQDMQALLRQARHGMRHLDACATVLPVFSQLQRIAVELARQQGCLPDCKAKSALLCAKAAEALAAVLQHCSIEQGHAQLRRAVPADRPRLLRANALLESACEQPWSVAALAQAVGLNEKRLQAGFQALYACSVHERLTAIRLDRAQNLLAQGHSITQTAQRCGFGSVSHFSKVFSRQLGMSPGQWASGQLGK
ncbi:helix-turn-helix transcriptional regulator [Vandammella animalimorsus]|nr:AraC family transcriptional regulator [Vandammella animalimorsus]